MENSTLERLVEHAAAILDGDVGLELLTDFSGQLGFLFAACDDCLLDCGGCIDNCPYPCSWPETTILKSPAHDAVVTLEGFAIGSGKNEGEVAGHFIVRDKKRNNIYSHPCIIHLPADN